MSDRRTTRPPQKVWPARFMRVDWGVKTQLFDHLIRQQGYRVRYQRNVACPCVTWPQDGGTGQPELDCASCRGVGRLYDKSREVETKAVVVGVSQGKRVFQAEGQMDLGSVQATFLSDVRVDYWDRCNFPDILIPVQEVHKRAGLGALTLNFEAVEVLDAYTRDQTTEAQVRLVEGTDFTVNLTTGVITLLATAKTYADMRVAFRYNGYPWWYVKDLPNAYRGRMVKFGYPAERWVNMPTRTILQRGDLMGRNP